VALETLETHLADVDLERLIGYAAQMQVTAVVKRLGWALERLDAPDDVPGATPRLSRQGRCTTRSGTAITRPPQPHLAGD